MNIDEKRLFEVKQELNQMLQAAAHFGMGSDYFTAKDFANRLDELIVLRIKQALNIVTE